MKGLSVSRHVEPTASRHDTLNSTEWRRRNFVNRLYAEHIRAERSGNPRRDYPTCCACTRRVDAVDGTRTASTPPHLILFSSATAGWAEAFISSARRRNIGGRPVDFHRPAQAQSATGTLKDGIHPRSNGLHGAKMLPLSWAPPTNAARRHVARRANQAPAPAIEPGRGSR